MAGSQGGKRLGAGRPSKAEIQMKEARETVRELHEMVKGGLRRGALAFDQLIEEELLTAFDPKMPRALRMQARHFLIDRILTSIKIKDVDEGPIKAIFQKWETNVNVIDVAGEAEERPIAAVQPPTIIEGTGIRPL